MEKNRFKVFFPRGPGAAPGVVFFFLFGFVVVLVQNPEPEPDTFNVVIDCYEQYSELMKLHNRCIYIIGALFNRF